MALPQPKGKQLEVLDLKPEGHNVVLGTAGSGKTTLAIYRAIYLATLDDKEKVMLVTFNTTLVKYLEAIVGSEIPRNIEVRNYHKFARGYLAHRNKMPRWNGIVSGIEDGDNKKQLFVRRALENVKAANGTNSTLKRAERLDGKTDYINCSVQYPNWWYLRRVKDNNPIFSDWAILFIDPIVATIETTQFCKVNAATRYGAYICKGAEAFRELFSANVGRQNRTKDMLQNAPTDDQAEVLVYENIPVSMIKGIAFENEEIARQKIVEWKVMGFPKIDVFISPELFDVPTSGKIRRGEEPLVKPYREEENELF